MFLVPFALGIAGQKAKIPLCSSTTLLYATCGISTGSILFALLSPRRTYSYDFQKFLVYFGTALLFFFLGAIHFDLQQKNLLEGSRGLLKLSDIPGRKTLFGQILRTPVLWEEGSRFIVGVIQEETPAGPRHLSGRVQLTVKGISPLEFKVGDWVRFSASLYPVRNFRTPGAFDVESYMALKGISVTAFVRNPLEIATIGHGTGSSCLNSFRYWLESVRSRLIQGVDESFQRAGPKGIAIALLAGQREWMPRDTKEWFARTGVGHLLAVSGLHMALVALLFGLGSRFVLLRLGNLPLRINVRKVSMGIALVATFLYAGIAGFSPSAVRAMVMIFAFGMAVLVDRPQLPVNALAIAAWFLLLLDPFYLFSPAFQLSFTAVFFLILFGSRFQPEEKEPLNGRTWNQRCQAWALAALIGFLGTIPLILWHFHRVSFVGIPLNFFLVPFASFLLLPGLFAGAFVHPVLPWLGAVIWKVTECVTAGLLEILHYFSLQDWAWRWMPVPKPYEIAMAYFSLLAAALVPKRKWMLAGLFLYCCLLVLLPLKRQFELSKGEFMALHVLDVGQGACQVVELPHGKVMVVDAGGLRSRTFDTGRMIVAPFLRTLGYTRIDVVALTHPQHDHIGGLKALFEEFPVREFWIYEGRWAGREMERLLETARAKGVYIRPWPEDAKMEEEGVQVEIYTPSPGDALSGLNNLGLVYKLGYRGCNALVTGDIEAPRERCLLEKDIGPVEVLVVPHHGSKTSSTRSFVWAIRPKAAIIPVGFRNPLDLPDPQVVERYRKAGAKIFRTDMNGTVSFLVENKP